MKLFNINCIFFTSCVTFCHIKHYFSSTCNCLKLKSFTLAFTFTLAIYQNTRNRGHRSVLEEKGSQSLELQYLLHNNLI